MKNVAVRLEGKHALAAVKVLPSLKLYRADSDKQWSGEEDAEPVSVEDAAAIIKEGNAHCVFTPIDGGMLREMIGRLSAYQQSFDLLEGRFEKMENVVLTDRAKFIRETAARLLAAKVATKSGSLIAGGPMRAELSKAAVDWAQDLYAEIWGRLEKEND